MRDNETMPWYTWVFSGVGAAIIVPLIGWVRGRVKGAPVTSEARVPSDPSAGNRPGRLVGAQPDVYDAAPAGSRTPISLVDTLLAIPGMNDPVFRQTIYEHVPDVVVQQLQMDRRARIELIGLIDTFGQYRHLEPWQALLGRLCDLLPAHPAVQQLAASLADLGLIDNAR